MKAKQLLLLPLVVLAYFSCGSDNEQMKEMEMEMLNLPQLTTKAISNITTSSAESGGVISELGNPEAFEVGLVYDDEPNPTMDEQSIMMAYSENDFIVLIQGLQANTTYYVKAFARNDNDVSYGNELSFTTIEDVNTTGPDCNTETNKVDVNGNREFTNVYDNGSTTSGPYTITANGNQGDMKFNFSKKPSNGYYITSQEISFLGDTQCSVTGVFSNFFWNARSGDTLFVNTPSAGVTSMTFCDFTFSTSQLQFDIENAFGNVTHED